jgi:hypothetical protein
MAHLEFRLLAFEKRESTPVKRVAIALGVAAAVAIAGLGTALYLGKLGYDVRRKNLHDTRLRRILVQTPTVYQVTEGLKEKAPLVAIVESDEDLERAVSTWASDRAEDIIGKARQWPQLRLYAAGDMIYFIYFDETNIMRDYVYVSS